MKIQTPHVDWLTLSPELSLLAAAAFCLMFAVLAPRSSRRGLAACFAFAGFVTAGIFAGVVYNRSPEATLEMGNAVARDRLGALAAIIVCGSGVLAVFVAYAHRMRDEYVAEYYALLATAGAGMCFLVQADNLMTIFLGLEWFSIALYVICAIDMELESSLESGLKYLIIGSFGSAALLFGSALVYGATGELGLSAIAQHANPHDALLVAGLAMILVGLCYKASAAPFHQWTPDVYQGAPTPITGFMAACTKVAAFGALLRVMYVALGGVRWDWRPVMYVIAALTMVVGTLFALTQTDIKRMLAYSSVAQAGFILVGVLATNAQGLAGTMVYLLAYGVATIGAFAIVTLVRDAGGEATHLSQWAGLGKRSPLVASAFALFLLAFAGIPLTSGFTGKFAVFTAGIAGGATWVVVVGVVASAVAAFFYVRVVVLMFFNEPPLEGGPSVVVPSSFTTFAITITVALTVVIGVLPQVVLQLVDQAGVFVR